MLVVLPAVEVALGLEPPLIPALVVLPVLSVDATELPLLVEPLPLVEDGCVLLDGPLDAELLALLVADDVGLPAWLLDDEELADVVPSAWAIPDPLASAAPTPRVSAPAPSHR